MADSSLVSRLAGLDDAKRRRLHEMLSGVGGRPLRPVPLERDGRPLPSSFLQERLWLHEQLNPGSAAYVVPVAMRLRGELDVGLLRAALGVVADRHEVLRTGLIWQDNAVMQLPRPTVTVPFDVVDFSRIGDQAPAVQGLLGAEAGVGFDLAEPPLLRARVMRLAARDHVLAIFLHHAVTDGWSNGILLREIGTVYRALAAAAEPVLPDLPVQYADFAAAQRRRLDPARLADLAAFWTGQLAGAPDILTLPTDRPRELASAHRVGVHRFALDGAAAGAANALAENAGSTSYAVLLAVIGALLADWSGQHDLLIGSPHSGRDQPDLEHLVGPFVNTLALRIEAADRPGAAELVSRAGRMLADAQDHADLPLEKLVERLRPARSAGSNPLLQVNLGMGNFPRTALELPGVRAEPLAFQAVTAKFDLAWYCAAGPDGWRVAIEYDTDLFDPPTIGWLRTRLCELLARAGQDPSLPLTGDGPARTAPLASRPGGGAGFVEPRDRWERQVAQVWQEVLGGSRYGATDDFFERGGHSLAGMLVTQRLSERSGRIVGLAALLRHSTVEGLAALLRSASPEPPSPFIAELRSGGDLPPLWFAHSAVGDVGMYFPLARALPAGRPLLGLQAAGFWRDYPAARLTLEQMAARYAAEMVASQPAGPYHLVGFSAAGRLALAVADRLHLAGRPAGAVILLDTAPFGDVAPEPDLAAALARWLPFAPAADELRTVAEPDLLAVTLQAGIRSGDLPAGFGIERFTRLSQQLMLTARALAGYLNPAYPGLLTLLVRAGRTDRDIGAEWRGLPIGELAVVPVDVPSHLDFLAAPYAPVVAQVITDCLARAEGR